MGLEGELEVTEQTDAVEFVFFVENGGTESIELTFRSGLQADVVVTTGETVVWRYSDGRSFTQALQSRAIEPGRELLFEATWTSPRQGDYVAAASLNTLHHPLTVRKAFRVSG